MSRKERKQQRGADYLWPQGENITSSQQETSVKYEGFPCLAALSGLIGWIRTAGLTAWLKHSGPKAGWSQFAQGTAVFLRVYVCTLVAACKFKSLTSKNCQNITAVRKLALRCLCCQVTAAGDDCVKISSRWGRRTTTCIWRCCRQHCQDLFFIVLLFLLLRVYICPLELISMIFLPFLKA